MILVDLPAKAHCEEPKCEHALSIGLCMTLQGTFAMKLPNGHGWQIGSSPQGVVTTRCPLHRQMIDQVAAKLESLEAVPNGRKLQ